MTSKVVRLFPKAASAATTTQPAIKRYPKPLSPADKLELDLLSQAALAKTTSGRDLLLRKADQAGTGNLSAVTLYLPSANRGRPDGFEIRDRQYDARRKPFAVLPWLVNTLINLLDRH